MNSEIWVKVSLIHMRVKSVPQKYVLGFVKLKAFFARLYIDLYMTHITHTLTYKIEFRHVFTFVSRYHSYMRNSKKQNKYAFQSNTQ